LVQQYYVCALKQLESVEMKGAKQNASAFQVETPLLGRAHHHGNVFLEQIQTFEVCRARFLPRTTRAPPEGREWQLLAAGNSWHATSTTLHRRLAGL
jgi:hypothetical protein